MASQNPPAPMPTLMRPPESRSRLAAARASDGRLAQRKVQDVRREMDARGGGGDVREKGPGVKERRLVRVVLEGHQVEAGVLAELRERDDVLWTPALRGEERSEAELVAVVGHRAGGFHAAM